MSENSPVPEQKQEPVFDFDRYYQLLGEILHAAQDEYRQFSLEWRNRQHSILKTYLWLAVTLAAAQFTLFSKVWGHDEQPFPWILVPGPVFYIFAFLALGTSAVAFCLGVDTLRGKDIRLAYDRAYEEMMNMAREESFISSNQAGMLEKTMILCLENGLSHYRAQGTRTGKRLRILSRLLLLSLFFFAIALLPWECGCSSASGRAGEVIPMANERPVPPADQPIPPVHIPPPVEGVVSASTGIPAGAGPKLAMDGQIFPVREGAGWERKGR